MPRMVEGVGAAIAGVEAAVRHLIVSPPRQLEAALTHYANTTHQLVPVTNSRAPIPATVVSAPHESLVQEIQSAAYNWSPVVMILFFAALLYLMWRTLKVQQRREEQDHHDRRPVV